jgi:hypothetical protein
MFLDQPLDLQNLSAAKSAADLEADRAQPKLRRLILTLDMDMGRLIPISGVEEEPIGPRA